MGSAESFLEHFVNLPFNQLQLPEASDQDQESLIY